MVTVNEKMTALADIIRAKSGVTGKLSLDGMYNAIYSIDSYENGYSNGYADGHYNTMLEICAEIIDWNTAATSSNCIISVTNNTLKTLYFEFYVENANTGIGLDETLVVEPSGDNSWNSNECEQGFGIAITGEDWYVEIINIWFE